MSRAEIGTLRRVAERVVAEGVRRGKWNLVAAAARVLVAIDSGVDPESCDVAVTEGTAQSFWVMVVA